MKELLYLKKLTDEGFEAYIVGGFVRDYILGIKSYDIDITTSATPKEVAKIFNISESDNLGCINIKSDNLNIDITTYREEKYYTSRYPVIKYTNSLNKDLIRRDFTINTICMDKDGKIIDLLNAQKDLEDRVLKVVGDIALKFSNDPLRILRALRISIVLDFQIEDNALSYIISNKYLLKNLSTDKIKGELDKILLSKNAIKGLDLLKTLNILDYLKIRYNKVNYCDDLIGMWAQINYSSEYKFSKLEKKRISNIRNIINDGKIDSHTIFKYGFYDSIVASKILSLDEKLVTSIYENMQIHTIGDLKINGNKIKSLLNIDKSPKIKIIKDDLVLNVLNGNLVNEEDSLTEYILEKWK